MEVDSGSRRRLIARLYAGFLIGWSLVPIGCSLQSGGPGVDSTARKPLRGPYLGQAPPGLIAQKFNNGVLVGDKRSFNVSFSPDGKELFFSYYKGTAGKPHPEYEIRTYRQVDDIWHGPEVASFSGTHSDVDITFSPDGNYLFFASDRPHPDSAGLDIYYVERDGEGWSEPIHAGAEVNSRYGEVLPCLSKKGNLFFRSDRPGGFGGADIYRAEWIDGAFGAVTNLGPGVNTEYGETDPIIAPDESYLLYDAIRPEHDNIPQIYVSFQIEDNVWSKGVSLGEAVNKKEGTSAPTLSPDGKYLFFKHRQGADRGLYWISADIVELARP